MALLWASALLAFLAAVDTTRYAVQCRSLVLAIVLFEPTALLGASPAFVAVTSLAAAALVGAVVGVLAERLTGPAPARAVILAVASLPALYVVTALVLVIVWFPHAPKQDAGALFIWAPLLAAAGMVMALPVADEHGGNRGPGRKPGAWCRGTGADTEWDRSMPPCPLHELSLAIVRRRGWSGTAPDRRGRRRIQFTPGVVRVDFARRFR